MKPKLSSLKNMYQGRAAAVLGGGPSLPGDLARVPAGALLIAVNHHAFHLPGCHPDMMVFSDSPELFPLLKRAVESFDGPKISFYEPELSTYVVDADVWHGYGSGIFGTWLACYLGCAPVLLCGMDLYQGNVKYCHAGEPGDKYIYRISLREHLERWESGFTRCPGIEYVRAMSGPLCDVFGKFDD